MSDIAEDDFEQGYDQWLDHLSGNCGPDLCQYCEEEED